VTKSTLAGSVDPKESVDLALTLPLRNQAQLDALLVRLYDPNDPLYRQYLTPEQFTAQFGPTQADYDAMIAYAQSQGLTVTQTHPNRLVLDVNGPASKVETAFGVKFKLYKSPTGKLFRAPNADPVLPTNIANRLMGISGLDNAAVRHPHYRVKPADPLAFLNQPAAPNPTGLTPFGLTAPKFGNGPGGGLTPNDIKQAYDLFVTADGTGQTLALFELDGYTPSDITGYENYYGLNNVPLQNVLVDGAGPFPNGSGGDVEVELDIQLMTALAPGANKIMVYIGPNSSAGVIDTYNKIATDNQAQSVSTSWGLPELYNSTADINSENAIYKQMATQGQSIFDASGDNGAYDDGATLSVDDPASQPFMTGVGGTTLTLKANGNYQSEMTWIDGGGGQSQVWAIPGYQSQAGVISGASLGSTTMRNVPDVSLDADPNTGYSLYYQGNWYTVGGTSCAAPLWAAFTSLVNQLRATVAKPTMGFMNPTIYQLGLGQLPGGVYTTAMHDIADGSTNQQYPAVTGYDLGTGWGTFEGYNLLGTLSGVTPTRVPPPPPPAQLIGDSGFENGFNYAPWVVTSSSIINNAYWAPANTGVWKALMGNTTARHTDKLYQSIAIPTGYKKSLTLSYALYVATNEGIKPQDTLTVMIRNAANTSTLQTLATYSNGTAYTAPPGYNTYTFPLNLKTYSGQTIIVMFQFTQSGPAATAALIDDVKLMIR